MSQNKQTGWKGKTRGGSFGYLFFIGLLKFLGIRAAYSFLCLVVVYFIPFAPRATAATWQYARGILKYGKIRSFRFLFLSYYRMGQILIDKIAVGSGQQDKYKFQYDNYSDFLDLLNGNQGVIMIGAHVGNWEIGAPFFDRYGKKMNIVMFDAEYQKVKKVLAKNMDAKNYKIIPVNQDNLTHVFMIKEALDRAEYVCFQGDRFVDGSQVLESCFMGYPARFPAGPFLLASRLKVPVVFYSAMREKGMRYRFHFEIARPVKRSVNKKMEADLLEQYIENLESMLKEYPEQWFNYYKFWN